MPVSFFIINLFHNLEIIFEENTLKYFYIALTFFLAAIFNLAIFSQWTGDPLQNLVVCEATGEQVLPKISLTSDGGCYIAWFDTRNKIFSN